MFKVITLLLADVFEKFRNRCCNIYELDPVYFVSVPGLAWQAYLKKTGVNLELLTDYDMLLKIEVLGVELDNQLIGMPKQIINI